MEEFNLNKIHDDLRRILRSNGYESTNEILGGIMDVLARKGTKGKCPDLGRIHGGGGFINLIPSELEGPCATELVVVCFDRDNINSRLVEAVYHAGIYCKDMNRKVLFLTSKWDSPTYEAHAKAIEILKYNDVDFCFVLIGKGGASLIPV